MDAEQCDHENTYCRCAVREIRARAFEEAASIAMEHKQASEQMAFAAKGHPHDVAIHKAEAHAEWLLAQKFKERVAALRSKQDAVKENK